jgi:ATP-dependent helicase/nuclease subunit B
METILGPFHPHLENAVVDEILRYKKSDLLSPLLILVPSDALRRRLKVLLAKERGLNLLNLHILTFHQLSLRLLKERHGAQAQPVHDNSLLEEILRQTIRMGLPGTAPFAGLEEKAGGCAALWQTLRDLKDGMVNPATALEATASDLFGEEGKKGVERIFALFQTFLSCCKKWTLQDYADLDLMALEQIASSAYLKQFSRIFYYGFYDLTQVQLDLFQAVAHQYPTTLFFPLLHERPQHPAWTFAERFYERYVHGLADGRSQAHNLAPSSDPDQTPSLLPLFVEGDERRKFKLGDFPVTIFSCFSVREEIDTVAKEILRLVSEEEVSFDQIGVVGRTLEPYLPWIKEIFSHHSIPVTTSVEEPLVQHPLPRAVLLLVNLPLRGYLRSHVIDLLDSPFFNNRSLAREGITPRPDLWDLLTRRLGITKGTEEWHRLQRHLLQDVVLMESADDNDEPKKLAVPAIQVQALWHLFTELQGDLEALPKEATWSRYVKMWGNLQKKWLSDDSEPATQRAAVEKVNEVLQRLSGLDVVSGKVLLSHFLQTYQHWLERSSIPFTNGNVKGVAVLDAMTARGISFRALFIIGLNEGLFPRTIREDAFLRDRERELLETVLGYKVATKLGGFDEERLLFTLLVGAAKEKLYCLHQRNDETGRPVAPSWYLDELCRAVGQEKIKNIFVPRGVTEKEALEPFDQIELLPPRELAIRLILTSKDPAPLVDLCLPSPSVYRRGNEVIKQLEAITDRLAEHDGVVGPVPNYWKRIVEQGLSPTSLEAYARCPFQFFARTLLGLERLKRPEETTGPSPADVGRQIVHPILKSFYQELMDRKFFLSGEKSTDTAAILKAVTQRVFLDFEQNNPIGYPLDWEIRREEIATLLEQVVAQDLKGLFESGYRPVAFECEATDRLPESWPSPLNGLTIRGRMDRIDYHPQENRYRVIDYKLKFARSRQAPDKDLPRSAVRGQRLQPPFYLLLGRKYASHQACRRAEVSIDVAFYFLAPHWPEGPFVVESLPGDAWEGHSGRSLKETVGFLAEAIRQGLFFIQPDDYCRYCEVSEACRRNHRPTMWRVERDPKSRAHLSLRDKGLNSNDNPNGTVA